MRFFKRKPPSPYTWKQRLTGEARVAMQEKDISQLRTLSLVMKSLETPPHQINHPLRDISRQLKRKIVLNDQGSFLNNMRKLVEYLEEDSQDAKNVYQSIPIDNEEKALDPQNFKRIQTSLRITNLRNYCKSMTDNADIDELLGVEIESDHVKYMIDLFLLGSGAERIAGHLRMIGTKNVSFTQALLQSSFYSVLEPEVETVSEAAMTVLESHKDHMKALLKITPTYLLDKLEVNVKSRCVFAWSDPNYAGYQPLDDDQEVAAVDIFANNYKYFPESAAVGREFVDKYISERQTLYYDTNENSTNYRYGAAFLVVTCILDQFLSNM